MSDTFAYKFLIGYFAFALFLTEMIILAVPDLPTDIISSEAKQKITAITSDVSQPSGLTGLFSLFSQQVSIFFTLLTLSSPIAWVARILFVFNMVVLFIFYPHILDFFRFLGELFSAIASNPLAGTIATIAFLIVIGAVILKVFVPGFSETIDVKQLQNVTSCFDCVKQNGKWVWCNMALKTAIGCVPSDTLVNPGSTFPEVSNITCVGYNMLVIDTEGCNSIKCVGGLFGPCIDLSVKTNTTVHGSG